MSKSVQVVAEQREVLFWRQSRPIGHSHLHHGVAEEDAITEIGVGDHIHAQRLNLYKQNKTRLKPSAHVK